MRAIAVLLLASGLAALGCRRPRPAPTAAPCTHVQATREVRGLALCEDVWTCARPPDGAFDRVGLRRIAACRGGTGPLVLYLPGMHMTGDVPTTDARADLRLYLAQAGIRTWAIDYRTHAVPADATPADLEALGHWTAQLFADDVRWAMAFVRAAEPGPIVLAGFSFGGALAYRVATAERPAGLVVLDAAAGAGRAPRGSGPALDVASGRLPWPARRELLAAVMVDPAAPSPLPGYPSAGAALADVLWTSPTFGGQGGLSAARDGASDPQLLARLLAGEDRWWPRAALDDAPPRPPRTPLPVLAFASTRLGPAWVERVRASARAWGGPGAEVRELPGYGHLDVLVGRNALRDVFEPVRAWLTGAPAD
ncbi:MAG TPA: hypothetical protein VKW76_09915 [Candidatus Binatia bacterium]|nr:hypothetical protein [Candidatus Binatia bacterium]